MTRDQAFDAARAAVLEDWKTRHPEWMWGKQSDSSVQDMLSVIEGLGLIKFDEPKTEEELVLEALQAAWRAAGQQNAMTGPLAIAAALQARGFQIARQP